MSPVFADTYYFLAILNKNDAGNEKAERFSKSHGLALVTTAWVLTELADALSRPSHRSAFFRVLKDLKARRETTIVPASQSLFEKGIELYNARPDKDWSLTDCVSFIVMEEHHLTDALTGDRHFEQAGFQILLK